MQQRPRLGHMALNWGVAGVLQKDQPATRLGSRYLSSGESIRVRTAFGRSRLTEAVLYARTNQYADARDRHSMVRRGGWMPIEEVACSTHYSNSLSNLLTISWCKGTVQAQIW